MDRLMGRVEGAGRSRGSKASEEGTGSGEIEPEGFLIIRKIRRGSTH